MSDVTIIHAKHLGHAVIEVIGLWLVVEELATIIREQAEHLLRVFGL